MRVPFPAARMAMASIGRSANSRESTGERLVACSGAGLLTRWAFWAGAFRVPALQGKGLPVQGLFRATAFQGRDFQGNGLSRQSASPVLAFRIRDWMGGSGIQ
jgi:hypothetical protein